MRVVRTADVCSCQVPVDVQDLEAAIADGKIAKLEPSEYPVGLAFTDTRTVLCHRDSKILFVCLGFFMSHIYWSRVCRLSRP